MNKSLKVTIDQVDEVKRFIDENKKDSVVFYSILDKNIEENLKQTMSNEFEDITSQIDLDIASKHVSALFFSYNLFVIVFGKRVFCSTSETLAYVEFISLFEHLKK